MTFANALPWWALLLVLASLAGISWLAYARFAVAARRRNALMGLRFITLALLVLFLLRPIRQGEDGMHDVIVPILVDASRSMSIEDSDGQRRIDRARDLVVHTLLPVLSPHFQVFRSRRRRGLRPESAATEPATACGRPDHGRGRCGVVDSASSMLMLRDASTRTGTNTSLSPLSVMRTGRIRNTTSRAKRDEAQRNGGHHVAAAARRCARRHARQ